MKKKNIIIIVILVIVFVGAIAGAIIGAKKAHEEMIQEWVESTDTYKEVSENLKISKEASENAKKALDELKEKENYYKTLYPDLFD